MLSYKCKGDVDPFGSRTLMISINLQLQSVVHLFLSVYRWIQFTGISSFCQKQCLVIFQNSSGTIPSILSRKAENVSPKEIAPNWSLLPPREPKGEYKVTSGSTVPYQGEPAKPAGKFQGNSLETTRKRIAAMLGRKS